MPTRSRRRVALAATTAALIAAAPLVLAEPAFAQYPPCPPLQCSAMTPWPPVMSSPSPRPASSRRRRLTPTSSPVVLPPPHQRPHSGHRRHSCSPSWRRRRRAATGAETESGGTVYLGTYTAYANGDVDGTVTIPEHTRPGHYRFTLEGETSGITRSVPLTVTGDGDGRGDDHGRPGHGDDHGRPGHGHHPGSGHGNGSGHDHDPSELATTGSSDATVALLSAAGGLVLLGGGSLVIVRRRRSHTERG